ncbi:hypothetical protein RIF29_05789 [Crotalaria pallida]|uniref:RNA methyltransferase n=1 Tax=Crotalaria pallida TaxID=3830 RepID=A0AAN9J3G2_CROPI
MAALYFQVSLDIRMLRLSGNDQIEEAYSNLSKIGSKFRDDIASSSASETSLEIGSLEERNVTDVVSFKQGNFVQTRFPLEEELYDTILCLSATHWVDLNVRANGLYALFQKIWNLLRPGGILVLEPQSLESYKRNNNHVSEVYLVILKLFIHGDAL